MDPKKQVIIRNSIWIRRNLTFHLWELCANPYGSTHHFEATPNPVIPQSHFLSEATAGSIGIIIHQELSPSLIEVVEAAQGKGSNIMDFLPERLDMIIFFKYMSIILIKEEESNS